MAIELTPFQREALKRAPERLRKLYANGSEKEKKTFLEAIEQRFRDLENKSKKASSKSLSKPKPEGPPKPKDSPKPKPNNPPRKSDQARKVKGKVVEPDPKKPKGGPNKPPKGGPNKPPKGSKEVFGKVGKQIAKKVLAPLEFVDGAQLALYEDARKQAEADYASMEEDHIISRGFKSFFNPIDTIYSAGSAIVDTSKYTPTYKPDPLRSAARKEERKRELEKRYAAMPPEEQAVYDENRNAFKEKQRAKQLKKIMENRAVAQRMIENGISDSVQRARGQTPVRYGYRDETGRVGNYAPEGYLKMTEKIARAQKAVADKAAVEEAAVEEAPVLEAAADRSAVAKAAADKAAADKSAAVAAAGQLGDVLARPEFAEFRDSSAEDYIKKLEQETASRRARLNKPLPEIDKVAAPAPEVEPPASEVDYDRQAVRLFKNTHGTSFDPNSRMDEGKLEKMKSMLSDMGGLGKMSSNEFALQFYRNS